MSKIQKIKYQKEITITWNTNSCKHFGFLFLQIFPCIYFAFNETEILLYTVFLSFLIYFIMSNLHS